MPGSPVFRRVHLAALVLCAGMLPWSTALLSMAQMLLLANWVAWGIAEGALKQRMRQAFTSPPVLVFLSFLGLHIVGLLWTTDQRWGQDLVRILAPVLVFGTVLGGGPRLTAGELRTVLLAGAWSAVGSALLSIALAGPGIADHRALSRFISHIRLSLLLCMAIVVLLFHMPRKWPLRLVHGAGVLAAVYALDRLESVQAALILFLIAVAMAWRRSSRWRAPWRWAVRGALTVVPIVALVWLGRMWERSIRLPVPAESGEGMFAPGGEPYTYDATNPQQENGRHVWAWVAWHEAERAWALRSQRPLDGQDDQGEDLYATLARYMTSMGLRKDSAGVMALSDADIAAVLAGTTTAHRRGDDGLYGRMEDLLQELALYRATGRADGHSLAQRLEYLRTGLSIARQHWMFGVGTGDTQLAFDREYERTGSPLEAQWRLRAHDLFLTWAISFGVFGAAWLLFSIIWPAWRMGAWRDPRFIAWAIAFGITSLANDTVETQAGATFFALFYALLVFAVPRPSGPATTARYSASVAAATTCG
ncbi:MAG: O-antigen ligase family protein [Flavobacteriales bacterium]|jgi:hypothetical protein|nr:O-antigen ligase family protein [Flavobacteriales bacterium]